MFGAPVRPRNIFLVALHRYLVALWSPGVTHCQSHLAVRMWWCRSQVTESQWVTLIPLQPQSGEIIPSGNSNNHSYSSVQLHAVGKKFNYLIMALSNVMAIHPIDVVIFQYRLKMSTCRGQYKDVFSHELQRMSAELGSDFLRSLPFTQQSVYFGLKW